MSAMGHSRRSSSALGTPASPTTPDVLARTVEAGHIQTFSDDPVYAALNSNHARAARVAPEEAHILRLTRRASNTRRSVKLRSSDTAVKMLLISRLSPTDTARPNSGKIANCVS